MSKYNDIHRMSYDTGRPASMKEYVRVMALLISTNFITFSLLLLVSYCGPQCGTASAACVSSPNCAVSLRISAQPLDSTGCAPTGNTSEDWVCGDLQSALDSLLNLSFSTNSSNISQAEDCVSIFIPAGDTHYITAPLFLGDISVHFTGISESEDACNSAGINGTMLPLPSISCNYTVDVDLDRVLDLAMEYSYIDYVLYFNQSAAVSFQNIEMTGCPYPVRVNSVDRVSIRNSLFR